MPEAVMPAGAFRVLVGSNIQAIVNAASEGATFWIEAGVHRMQAITPKDGQQFYGAEGSVLNGSRLLTSFTREGALWVASGQNQQGERRATEEGADGAARPGYPDAVFIDNKPLTHVGSKAEVAPGTFYFDYEADKIYLGNDPGGRMIEASVSPFAFAGDATGVVIDGLTIEKYASPVQYGAVGYNAPPTNWSIRDNEVRLNFGVGIIVGDDSEVVDNYVHDNGEMGIGGNGAGILIDGNEIASNGYFSGVDPYWEGGGTKFAATDGLIVRNNYSHSNNGYGLWTDIDNINTLYENNLVENNQGSGINHEISYDAIIRNNTIFGNGVGFHTWMWGAGIQIQNSRNVEIYGNKVDMSGGGNGISLIQQDRGTGAYGPYSTIGNSVHDNILKSVSTESSFGIVADHDEAGLLAGGNVFDRNEYQVTSGQDDHWVWGDWYSWADYRAATGQDANSKLVIISATPSPTPVSLTLGAGSDALVLQISQDAYKGSAQYTVNVDGKQIGGVQTATALHGNRQSDTVTVRGDWSPGSHTANVTFLNDEWGGTAATDRNLYVDGAAYNGAAMGGAAKALLANGSASFAFTDVATANLDLQGTAGGDSLTAGAGADRLRGLAGNDTLFGGAGTDALNGGVGADVLNGGAGNDYLLGGAGADTLTGGAGPDRFAILATNEGCDTVFDFNVADGDRLDLRGVFAVTGQVYAKLLAGGFIKVSAFAGGVQVLVDADGGGNGYVALATLNGLTVASLGNDFLIT